MKLRNCYYDLIKRSRLLGFLLVGSLAIAGIKLKAQHRPLNDLDVPESHPRLFFSDETLAKAKEWYSSHPYTPRTGAYTIYQGSRAVDAALFYLLTDGLEPEEERKNAARNAIGWAEMALEEMVGVNFSDGTCNECRWYMEYTLLILDWCDSELTEAEHHTFYSSLSELIPMWNEADWGGPDHPRSNFNHGYWRQSITFALLIYHENKPLAMELLDDAINERFGVFKEYAKAGGVSGIPTEGASYNYTMLSYQILVAGISMANAGYDYVRETPFFEKAYIHTIYNTTPDKAFVGPNATHSSWLPFPYGDAGAFMNTNDWDEALGEGYANAMLAAALLWKGEGKLPEYYRGWVERHGFFEHNIPPLKFIESVTYDLPQADVTELSTDYFAPGGGHTPYGYARTSWETDATAISVQLGKAPEGGHEHNDAGTFTIAKGNRFLIIPPSGRGFGSGWKVPDYDNIGSVDVQNSISKNTILFGKEGSVSRGHTIDSVDRLMTHPDFFYAANDITPTYLNFDNLTDIRFNNEHIENFVRETLFIRPLETLVVFDRTESLEGQDLTKTSLLHVQGEPTQISERRYSTVNGDYEAVIDIVLPENLNIKVIDETTVSDCDWCNARSLDTPFRLQMENTNEKSAYFLNVIQAKTVDESRLERHIQETENTYLLTLSHPTKGFAVIEFQKGQVSTGGRFGYDANSIPTELMSLPEEAQYIDVTNDGPVWYEVGTRPVSETPEITLGIESDYLFDDFEFSVSASNLQLNFKEAPNQEGMLRVYGIDGSSIYQKDFFILDKQVDVPLPGLNKNTVYVFEVRIGNKVTKSKLIIE